MPMSSADAPSAAEKPVVPKAKPAPTGLELAALSSDPLVQKLMWDRGYRASANDPHVAVIDAELRKLGFDI